MEIALRYPVWIWDWDVPTRSNNGCRVAVLWWLLHKLGIARLGPRVQFCLTSKILVSGNRADLQHLAAYCSALYCEQGQSQAYRSRRGYLLVSIRRDTMWHGDPTWNKTGLCLQRLRISQEPAMLQPQCKTMWNVVLPALKSFNPLGGRECWRPCLWDFAKGLASELSGCSSHPSNSDGIHELTCLRCLRGSLRPLRHHVYVVHILPCKVSQGAADVRYHIVSTWDATTKESSAAGVSSHQVPNSGGHRWARLWVSATGGIAAGRSRHFDQEVQRLQLSCCTFLSERDAQGRAWTLHSEVWSILFQFHDFIEQGASPFHGVHTLPGWWRRQEKAGAAPDGGKGRDAGWNRETT